MRRSLTLSAGGAVFALVATAGALAWRRESPLYPRNGGAIDGTEPLFLVLLVAAFAVYVFALLGIRRMAPSTRAVIAVAAAIQLVPLTAPLLLSTDAWSYWSYGWIATHGDGNPYADPPSEFPANPALPHMGSAWLDTTSVYGPVFTLASQPVALVADDSASIAAWTFKALAAAAALAAALLAGRLARRKALAVAFVGWNPLLAVHLAGGGHNDAWVGALILAALALAGARRTQAAGAVWAVAIALKWVPALFLALRAIEARATGRQTTHRGFIVAAAAVFLASTLMYGTAWPRVIAPLVGSAALETSYAIPNRLEQLGLPDALALAIAGAFLAVGAVWLVREATRGRARLALAACLVLVTTPYLAVWYLAWAVPLAAAEDDDGVGAVCLLLCAYLLPQTIPI